jgi:hypothetical protein
VGRLKASVTVDPTAIPWLRLSAASTAAGPDGDRLVDTTYIQRIATTGGGGRGPRVRRPRLSALAAAATAARRQRAREPLAASSRHAAGIRPGTCRNRRSPTR